MNCSLAGLSPKQGHWPTLCRPTTDRRHQRGWVKCVLGGSQAYWSSATKTSVTPLMVKEPMLGWEVPARYSRAHLKTQLELQNPSPGEGLDSLSVWCYPWWEAVGWGGYLSIPSTCTCMLEFFPVDERICYSSVLIHQKTVLSTQPSWSGWGAWGCSTWGLCHLIRKFPHSYGQQQWDQMVLCYWTA